MQGVIKSFDPSTQSGTILCDSDLAEYELCRLPLTDSIFRMLRQGQRVCFVIDTDGFAADLTLGSEADMRTPTYLDPEHSISPVVETTPPNT